MEKKSKRQSILNLPDLKESAYNLGNRYRYQQISVLWARRAALLCPAACQSGSLFSDEPRSGFVREAKKKRTEKSENHVKIIVVKNASGKKDMPKETIAACIGSERATHHAFRKSLRTIEKTKRKKKTCPCHSELGQQVQGAVVGIEVFFFDFLLLKRRQASRRVIFSIFCCIPPAPVPRIGRSKNIAKALLFQMINLMAPSFFLKHRIIAFPGAPQGLALRRFPETSKDLSPRRLPEASKYWRFSKPKVRRRKCRRSKKR